MLQGIATFAGVLFFIYAYKWICALVQYFQWRKQPVYVGTFHDLKSKISVTENSYFKNKPKKIQSVEYTYILKFKIDGKVFFYDYLEKIKGDGPSRHKLNDTVEMYVNQATSEIKPTADVQSGMRSYPVACAVSAAVVVVCILIVAAISR